MNWLLQKQREDRVATQDRLHMMATGCPDCQWPDTVVLRSLYRHWLSKVGDTVKVETEECGKVVRCARCVKEFCVGPSGVYVPFPLQEKPPTEEEKKKRAVPPPSPQAGMPWNKG